VDTSYANKSCLDELVSRQGSGVCDQGQGPSTMVASVRLRRVRHGRATSSRKHGQEKMKTEREKEKREENTLKQSNSHLLVKKKAIRTSISNNSLSQLAIL
jgi:hypothetical protein